MKTKGVFSVFLCAAAAALAPAGCGAVDEGDGVAGVQGALVAFTPLALVNGWTAAPLGTAAPASALVSGIVYLKGGMATAGTNPVPFTLPAGRRPTTAVYVPLNLCNATKGRLFIPPSGTVTVVAEGGAFSNAQCSTSLDGVSFAVSTAGWTALPPQNGWTNAPFSTRNAALLKIGDVVHLAGAIATGGTNPVPFTLPIGMAPSTDAYLPVDLCNAAKGRLRIDLGGVVTVVAEGGAFGNAQCFTSLEGVSFPLSPASGSGFTCLTPEAGWSGAPFSTRFPCVRNDDGIVRLLGAVRGGSGVVALTLPSAFRPAATALVDVDMCNGTQGRVVIAPNGTVSTESKTSFVQASCFTSFEGVTFVR